MGISLAQKYNLFIRGKDYWHQKAREYFEKYCNEDGYGRYDDVVFCENTIGIRYYYEDCEDVIWSAKEDFLKFVATQQR